MRLLSQLLVTFALGMIATGVVLGLLPGGECGRAFSGGSSFTDPDGCSADRADRRVIPVALIGLGVTTAIAAGIAYDAAQVPPDERS